MRSDPGAALRHVGPPPRRPLGRGRRLARTATRPGRGRRPLGRDLLVHARRTGILAEKHRPKVFNARPCSRSPTFLVHGRVAGACRYETGKVKLEPFERLDGATRRALRDEADRLADLHA